MSRKPRSDAKLKSLPPGQKRTLVTWLVEENMPYDKALERLEQKFGVRSSVGAVSQFYATECFSVRASEAKEFAERAAEALRSSPQKFEEATIALVRQKAFEQIYAKTGDMDALTALMNIIGEDTRLRQNAQKLELEARRVSLLEEKMLLAKAEITAAIQTANSKGGLTPETLKRIEEAAALL